MLVVISPAKRLDWEGAPPGETQPDYLPEANRLAGHMRQLSLRDLSKLMDLSPDLARLNRDRFRGFSADPDAQVTRAAAHAFAGDTYLGLEAKTLDGDAMAFAQSRLRILSGLYGLLRPMDAIQPYRLEMGSRLKTRRGTSLYDFWGETLAKHLRAEAEALGTDTLLNCASQEYFGAVPVKALGLRVITPVFLEDKGGVTKQVSFFAKRARGAMARFVVERRVTEPDGLKAFDSGGYRLDAAQSDGDRWVFVRPYPDAAAA